MCILNLQYEKMTAFALAIALGLCTVPALAQTQVESLFELDGNAIDETDIGNPDASPPDDWAQGDDTDSSGYVSGPNVDSANPGGGASVSAFIKDPNGDTGLDNIFTGGGSKDDLPIEGWKWTIGTPPDKDDLLAIGAAAYIEGTDLLIYGFGSLYSPNGNSSIGGWFFKKNIGPCSNGGFGVVDSSLPGRPCLPDAEQPEILHSIGDLLVISENTNGGSITNMSVYQWVGGDGVECANKGGTLVPPKDNLCLIGTFAGATCDGNPASDPYVCGIMNQVDTESPDDYYYMSKFPPVPGGSAHPLGTNGIGVDDFPPISFFEGGVNISEVLGGAECFSSFLRNTRTSAKPRSQLKDFASGGFSLCGINVVKTCPDNRDPETGGFCSVSDVPCTTGTDCTTEGDACVLSNPQFLFGDTVRTQFEITIGKDGPANFGNVMLTEETLDGCEVVTIRGTALATPIPLPKGTKTKVLESLTTDSTLVMECDTSSSVTTQKVTVEAKIASGSTVGPESFTLVDNNCKPPTSPGLNLTKECNGAVKLVKTNDLFGFEVPVKITVSNTGDEDLTNIEVSDDKIGSITTTLSLEKGAMPMVFEETYVADSPDNGTTTEWLGCDVVFSDTASIDAATGAFSGLLSGEQLPLDVPVTCVFCPDTCSRTTAQ